MTRIYIWPDNTWCWEGDQEQAIKIKKTEYDCWIEGPKKILEEILETKTRIC